jgi:hypothetical protein
MKATGRISINSIRSHELERKTDILSIGSISPPTGAGGDAGSPLLVGPDLTVKACTRLAFKSINYIQCYLTE